MVGTVIFIIFTIIPLSMERKPNTLFWRPRLAIDHIDFASKIDFRTTSIRKPETQKNIHDGFVVKINGYSVGVSLIALAKIINQHKAYDDLNPMGATYYTNAYRWFLRHMSMYEDWLVGKDPGYPITHRVWEKRYSYNDRLVPKWLQPLFPWVDSTEWTREKTELKKFNKYAEPLFKKYQIYPSKNFGNFTSQIVKSSTEMSSGN